jgi:hypothetical protein
LILLSCEEKSYKEASSDIYVHSELWEDKTEPYLPITGEWTNRVEVAYLNGDKMIDLLFANGENYSSPRKPEYS